MPTILYFAACLASLYLGYEGYSPWWIAVAALPAMFKAYGHRTLGDEMREALQHRRAFRQGRVVLQGYGRSLIDCSVYFVLGFAWADLLTKLSG